MVKQKKTIRKTAQKANPLAEAFRLGKETGDALTELAALRSMANDIRETVSVGDGSIQAFELESADGKLDALGTVLDTLTVKQAGRSLFRVHIEFDGVRRTLVLLSLLVDFQKLVKAATARAEAAREIAKNYQARFEPNAVPAN